MKRVRLYVYFNDINFARNFSRELSEWFDIQIVDKTQFLDLSDSNHERAFRVTDLTYVDADVYMVWDPQLEGDNRIFAFSGIHSIKNRIMHLYSTHFDDYRPLVGAGNTSLYGVSSCRGGFGCTSFALALAKELEGKTLWLTFDDIPYRLEDCYTDAPLDVNRCMYDITYARQNMTPDSCTYTADDRIYHLRYREPYNFLDMVDSDRLVEFLARIGENYFRNIVIDLGSGISQNRKEVLGILDHLYVLKDDKSDKNARFAEFVESSFAGKLTWVRNMVDDDTDNILNEHPEFIIYSDDRTYVEESMCLLIKNTI